MPPAYVKPYVKRHKNDATDAEAICEAVTRPNMRFVATKTPERELARKRHFLAGFAVVEFIEFTRAIEAYAIRILRQEIKRYTASEN